MASLISSASRYEKLAIGADGLRSLFLPKFFLEHLIDGFIANQTKIGQLELDFEWLQFSADRVELRYS